MLDNTATLPQTIFSVSELNFATKRCLEEGFPHIWVRGEIADLKRHYSGHTYFTLKDSGAQIRCALFRSRSTRVVAELSPGMQIVVSAQVSIYPDRGDYQLIVSSVIPEGEGQLQLAFNALKKTLAARGWFETARKRALPRLPKYIGIVTSPTGAAIQDVLTVLRRRCPAIPIMLYPTAVQGNTAASNIVSAIQLANKHAVCDVLIVTRGGGSLEDLWPFNEEGVAEAILHSQIPLVSAVGHEIDFTISDFVADQRAATPSAAAEIVSPDQIQLSQTLRYLETRLLKNASEKLMYCAQKIDWLEQRLMRSHPKAQLMQQNEILARAFKALEKAMHRQLTAFIQRWRLLTHQLDTLSPLATLSRGYAIIRDAQTKQVLNSIAQAAVNQKIEMQFVDGSALAEIINTK
jgi:exodeoxyribonuclease VII large subunit